MTNRLKVERHPLQNVEIMSTVFRLLPVNDLKSCRQVGSRFWLKTSMPTWRKRAVLKVRAGGPEARTPYGHNGISLGDLRLYVHDDEDPLNIRGNKKFRNLKLEGLRRMNPEDNQNGLAWLLVAFSNRLYHLTLKNCEFLTFRSFMTTITERLPNLVELKLENVVDFHHKLADDLHPYPEHLNLKRITFQLTRTRFSSSAIFSDWNQLPRDPMEIFLRSAPKLEDLKIKSPEDNTESEEAKHILKVIALIRREDPSKLQLRNLDVCSVPLLENGFTGTGDHDAFTGMPLEEFKGTTCNITNLFSSWPLKTLNLSFFEETGRRMAAAASARISLPLLKEFRTDGPPFAVFKNLERLEAKNLETLIVEDFYSSDIDFRRGAMIRLLNSDFGNVTKLECYNSSQKQLIISLEDFNHLSRAMPNVRNAKMPLTRNAFKKLCKTWPNLLTLTIPYRNCSMSKIDDETITGIQPGSRRGSGAKGKRPPNITDLKLLTDFVCFAMLTDHSVYFGFLQLPRLHYLNVKFGKISEEAKSALQKKVNVLEARVINFYAVSTVSSLK